MSSGMGDDDDDDASSCAKPHGGRSAAPAAPVDLKLASMAVVVLGLSEASSSELASPHMVRRQAK